MEASDGSVERLADRLAALGTEHRLRILRLLITAHPRGMVAGEIQKELGIPASTLSHHLEKLRHEALVRVRRDRQFLWYTAEIAALREILNFLYEECCTRGEVIPPETFAARASRPKIRRRKP